MQQDSPRRLFEYGPSLHEAVFPRALSLAEQEALTLEASTNGLFLLEPKHKAVLAGDRRSIVALPKVAWVMFGIYSFALTLIVMFWELSILSLPREADGTEISSAVRDFSMLLAGVTLYVVLRLAYSKWWRLRLTWGGVLLPAVVVEPPANAYEADNDGDVPSFVCYYRFLQPDGLQRTEIYSAGFYAGEVPKTGKLLAVLYASPHCFMLL